MRRLWMLLPVLALTACLETKDDDDEDEDEDDETTDTADPGWDTGTDADTDADTDSDTDSDTDTDTDWDTDTDSDTDTDTGSGGGLEVDAVYFQYEFTTRNSSLVPYVYDGTEVEGFAYVWFIDSDDWEGTEDTTAGCIVAFELTSSASSVNSALRSAGWMGWDLDSMVGASESCDDVSNLWGHPVDVVSDHTWGVGAAPLSADLESVLSDAWGADWNDYAAGAFGGIVEIDGEVAELSYGVAFEIDSDNNLVVDSDDQLSLLEVGSDGAGGTGHFRAFPAYGLDATAL